LSLLAEKLAPSPFEAGPFSTLKLTVMLPAGRHLRVTAQTKAREKSGRHPEVAA